MTIIKRDIKKVFAEFKAIDHEMFLVDYSSSDDEFITRVRIVHLNSMSLNFMLNDSQTTVNIVIAERIENVASNVAADNDRSMNFMNITANISEDDVMDIAASISEDHFMDIAASISENDFMDSAASISEEDFMNIAESISDEDSTDNHIIITRNLRDQIVRIIEVECSRREILLKRLISSKVIGVKNINIMKEPNLPKSKKINLKDLTSKFKKSLKAQALKKQRSSREEKDMELEINEKTYHVDMTIKHLHSCARFFLRNSEINLLIMKSSVKLTKLMINKTLTRIFCGIVRNVAENKS
jgi:hypothetical protein